jgi:hypothetical protein
VSFIGIPPSISDGVSRRHHRSPAVAIKPAGQNPEERTVLDQARTLTLCSQRKSSPFWIILWLVAGGPEHHTTHATESQHQDTQQPGMHMLTPDAESAAIISRSGAQRLDHGQSYRPIIAWLQVRVLPAPPRIPAQIGFPAVS